MTTNPETPAGLDLPAIHSWLSEHIPNLRPLTAKLIVGGKSNLTYRITSENGKHWVLRRPPLGHVLATAHDMQREYTVMKALNPSSVPVPTMIAMCTDPEITGAPFYVMEDIPGTAYRSVKELAQLGEAATRALSTTLIQTLAHLHAINPGDVGLENFGKAEGFLSRQVHRWGKQLQASRSRDLAGIDTLLNKLTAAPPALPKAAIVHGDYRLDNCIVQNQKINAIVDWEMATIGDPLTDLALLLVYMQLAELFKGTDISNMAMLVDASNAPGFLSRAEIVETYYQAGGPRPETTLGFYLALSYFKLAVILEGIHYRHSKGQTLGPGFDGIGTFVEPLIDMGIKAFKADH